MAYNYRRRRAPRPAIHPGVQEYERPRVEAQLGRPLEKLTPVRVDGRTIAHSVWGRAFCTHLERYSDFANRLPRGRTYLRSGAVLHLDIEQSRITAAVRGSELYVQHIDIVTLSNDTAETLADACANNIESTVTLLSGRLPKAVLSTLTDPKKGLFPEPHEISLHCSCPDGAYLCKHLASVLYGVAARLDERPELLFILRGVDPEVLARQSSFFRAPPPPPARQLDADLAELFDIDLADGAHSVDSGATETSSKAKRASTAVQTKRAAAPSKGGRRAGPTATEPAPSRELPEAPAIDDKGRLLVSRSFLIAAGLSPSQINSWRRRDHLVSSGRRGVYELTPGGWQALKPLLDNE